MSTSKKDNVKTLVVDLSGSNGLVNNFTVSNNDKYLGEPGEFANGIFDPFYRPGYIKAANNIFTDKTVSPSTSVPMKRIVLDEDLLTGYAVSWDKYVYSMTNAGVVATEETYDTGISARDLVLHTLNDEKAIFVAVKDTNTLTSYINVIGFVERNFVTSNDQDDVLITTAITLVDTTSDDISNKGRGMAQRFLASDGSVSSVVLPLVRTLGAGTGVTLKISIQTDSTSNAGLFTSRGAWSNAITNYALNNTVTHNSVTYQCIQAHSAVAIASEEPGVGTAWEDYWNEFSAPTGTILTSTNILATSLPLETAEPYTETTVTFSTETPITNGSFYWVVVEEVGNNMGVGNIVSWAHTVNADSTFTYSGKFYNSSSVWRDINLNGSVQSTGVNLDSYSMKVNAKSYQKWSEIGPNGAFSETEYTNNQFLHLSDGLIYWFTGNSVHVIDGTSRGGPLGRIIRDALKFSSYIYPVDAAETRSHLYIGVQPFDVSDPADDANTSYKSMSTKPIGVFVWDKQTQVLGDSEFFPCYGARKLVKVVADHNGDVLVFTINNSDRLEIRKLSGNAFVVVKELPVDAQPGSLGAFDILGSSTVWLSVSGIIYAYGSPIPGGSSNIYKIGKTSTITETGALRVFGNTSGMTTIYLGVQTTDTTGLLRRWNPNATGSVDAVSQTGNSGDVFSKVELLPTMSTVKKSIIRCLPCSNSATQIATVNYYFNQSSTASITKTVLASDAKRGYIEHEINKPYVTSMQIEVEFAAVALDGPTFDPFAAVITYEPTNTSTADLG